MNSRRTRVVVTLVGGALVIVIAGCGSGGAQAEDAPIRVDVLPMYISVENRAGMALRDVQVKIVPYGGATEFIQTVYRMANAEKKDFMLGDFRGKDGTPFNARVVKVKMVQVSGTDINGTLVEVEVPWK